MITKVCDRLGSRCFSMSFDKTMSDKDGNIDWLNWSHAQLVKQAAHERADVGCLLYMFFKIIMG